jgi:RNA polymerase sigma factor (TIGR02999 family)
VSTELQITDLLVAARGGNIHAREDLIPLVYREMHRLARQYLRSERSNHTLQPTALVNEVYLRLFNGAPLEVTSRSHFYAIAATQMRQVLIDHARRKRAQKRTMECAAGDQQQLMPPAHLTPEELLTLDEALTRFKVLYPRAGTLVELRYFAGLTEAETAEILDISISTTKREWNFAKAWLLRELTR